jgi:hypothetical protein
VPRDDRRLHGKISFHDVEIAVADAGGLDADLDFARTGREDLHAFQTEGFAGLAKKEPPPSHADR